jgi:hypothetical protein
VPAAVLESARAHVNTKHRIAHPQRRHGLIVWHARATGRAAGRARLVCLGPWRSGCSWVSACGRRHHGWQRRRRLLQSDRLHRRSIHIA